VDEKTKLTPTEARAGSRGGTVRLVLVASLILVIAAFAIVYLNYG
jgi:hypothetical protein